MQSPEATQAFVAQHTAADSLRRAQPTPRVAGDTGQCITNSTPRRACCRRRGCERAGGGGREGGGGGGGDGGGRAGGDEGDELTPAWAEFECAWTAGDDARRRRQRRQRQRQRQRFAAASSFEHAPGPDGDGDAGTAHSARGVCGQGGVRAVGGVCGRQCGRRASHHTLLRCTLSPRRTAVRILAAAGQVRSAAFRP
jgi:hypothetical protein